VGRRAPSLPSSASYSDAGEKACGASSSAQPKTAPSGCASSSPLLPSVSSGVGGRRHPPPPGAKISSSSPYSASLPAQARSSSAGSSTPGIVQHVGGKRLGGLAFWRNGAASGARASGPARATPAGSRMTSLQCRYVHIASKSRASASPHRSSSQQLPASGASPHPHCMRA
jgi:hypothetical protein